VARTASWRGSQPICTRTNPVNICKIGKIYKKASKSERMKQISEDQPPFDLTCSHTTPEISGLRLNSELESSKESGGRALAGEGNESL
jgi:hypothetical protein